MGEIIKIHYTSKESMFHCNDIIKSYDTAHKSTW